MIQMPGKKRTRRGELKGAELWSGANFERALVEKLNKVKAFIQLAEKEEKAS